MSSGGDSVSVAPVGRMNFVRSIVDDFERNRLGVDEQAVDYILTAVMPSERRWADEVRAGRVDLSLVDRALRDALEEAGSDAEGSGRLTVTRADVELVFPRVLEARWHCPYPLLLC